MTTDHHEPTTSPEDPHDPANDAADNRSQLDATAAPEAADPVNLWATEHYGFDDSPSAPAAAAPTAGAAAKRNLPVRPRRWVLLAAGVLGMIMTGTIGGVAIATSGDEGLAGGRDRVVQRDENQGGGGRGGGDAGGGRGGGFR